MDASSQTFGCLEITDIRVPDGMMDPTLGWYINIYILKLVDQNSWQQLQLQLHYGEYKIICQFLLLTEIQKQNDHQPNS